MMNVNTADDDVRSELIHSHITPSQNDHPNSQSVEEVERSVIERFRALYTELSVIACGAPVCLHEIPAAMNGSGPGLVCGVIVFVVFIVAIANSLLFRVYVTLSAEEEDPAAFTIHKFFVAICGKGLGAALYGLLVLLYASYVAACIETGSRAVQTVILHNREMEFVTILPLLTLLILAGSQLPSVSRTQTALSGLSIVLIAIVAAWDFMTALSEGSRSGEWTHSSFSDKPSAFAISAVSMVWMAGGPWCCLEHARHGLPARSVTQGLHQAYLLSLVIVMAAVLTRYMRAGSDRVIVCALLGTVCRASSLVRCALSPLRGSPKWFQVLCGTCFVCAVGPPSVLLRSRTEGLYGLALTSALGALLCLVVPGCFYLVSQNERSSGSDIIIRLAAYSSVGCGVIAVYASMTVISPGAKS